MEETRDSKPVDRVDESSTHEKDINWFPIVHEKTGLHRKLNTRHFFMIWYAIECLKLIVYSVGGSIGMGLWVGSGAALAHGGILTVIMFDNRSCWFVDRIHGHDRHCLAHDAICRRAGDFVPCCLGFLNMELAIRGPGTWFCDGFFSRDI